MRATPPLSTPPLYPAPWKGQIRAGGQVAWLLVFSLGLFTVLFILAAVMSIWSDPAMSLPMVAMAVLFGGFAVAFYPRGPGQGPAGLDSEAEATTLAEGHWLVRLRVILPGVVVLSLITVAQLWQSAARWLGRDPGATDQVVWQVVANVLLLTLSVLAWRMVLRSRRADAILLTPSGVRPSRLADPIPWDTLKRIDASAQENLSSRLPQNATLWLDLTARDGDAQRVRVDHRAQHPCVVLGMLEAYRSHPELRSELGTPASVERSRAMTDQLATLTRFGPPS